MGEQEQTLDEKLDNISSGEQPIGKKQIADATSRMKKYKEGKANLEKKIIENEQWWKMRHWEMIRNDQEKDDNEPASAWLFNSIANKHADAMDNYPEPCVLPRACDDDETAKQLSSILPVILEQNDYEQVYSDVWWYKLKQGTGVKGIFWDNTKLNGLGDVTIQKIDILNVFWEPGITDIQKSRDFFCVELVDNDILNSRYPDAHIQGNGIGEISKYIYDDHTDTTEKSLVIDWYYKKTERDEDGKMSTKLHYVKYVNDYIIYASENDPEYASRGFYDHGKYPFVFDTLFAIEGSPAGFGYIDVMRNCQMYIDKMDKAILENCLISSKKRWMVSDGCSINEEEFADLSKPFVHVTGSLDERTMKEISGNALDSVIATIRNNKIEELKETSGNRDFSQGSTSSGVTAASAISALMEAGSKLSRDMLKSAYRSFQNECYIVIELIRQFYTEPRCFRITGNMGRQDFVTFDNRGLMPQPQGMDFGVDLGSRKPVFDITVTASKKSTYSKMSQNELALQFYQLGFFNPGSSDMSLSCLEMMDFDGKDKIMQKIEEKGTMYQQIMMLNQQVMQLSAIVEADHPELQGSLLNQAAGQISTAMQTEQPKVQTQNSQTQAEQSKEAANNQASPV